MCVSMHDELGLFVFGFGRELEAVDLCFRCFDLSCDLEWFYFSLGYDWL